MTTQSTRMTTNTASTAEQVRQTRGAELEAIARYRRVTNYLAAAQIYLKDNVLLEEPLKPDHIKDRLLGHWGTSPGINLIYAHLNHLIMRYDIDMFLVTGPGHGAPANLANLYLEGTLQEFYPELTFDRAGLHQFVRRFSWPGGFPSHLYPGVPGTIHEGGELGYALATAFGAAMDNPDGTSRYHLIMQAIRLTAANNVYVATRTSERVHHYEYILRSLPAPQAGCRRFFQANGVDPEDITNWHWK